MSKLLITYIDVSFFVHATEDESKVIEAARHLLPKTRQENISFDRSGLRGHHGNPITLFETKIEEKDIVKAVADNFAANLSLLDKEMLLQEINLHLDKGNLYLRYDKQAAYQGTFKLGVADPIRVRLRFKKSRLEDVVQICREIGILP